MTSLPNIIFLVGLCARFQIYPKESHLTAVKLIFKYLVGTTNTCLWCRKNSHFYFIAYCDADYAGDKLEIKSTSGTCQFLRYTLTNWSYKNKNIIAIPTTEAEYVSAASCCSQILCIKNQLKDYSLQYSKVHIFCDNTCEINF